MELPKLYAPVTIQFWSLRNGVGESLGVIFDIDTEVTRKVRRVRCKGGWKWQIIDFPILSTWDWSAVTDQEILDEYGSGIEVKYLDKGK